MAVSYEIYQKNLFVSTYLVENLNAFCSWNDFHNSLKATIASKNLALVALNKTFDILKMG